MSALEAADYRVVPVGRLADYLSRKIAADLKLRRLGVSGEISGLTTQANGNIYFDLKDRDAIIKCIAWSAVAQTLPALANGQQIVAIGGVATFAKRSIFQLVVVAVEHVGSGRLHALYEDLKRRLQAEGLFDQARKRPLPAFPFSVALVSSGSANGAGDFVTQAARRAPHVKVQLFETSVQGANAAGEIVRAIGRASCAAVDLVVLARGGGSYEDLFVFSDERVVRALARCAHPTVSAIGHEADAPLTDFVADRREATPTSAAHVLPRRAELLALVDTRIVGLERSLSRTLDRTRRQLANIEVRSPLWAPQRLLLNRRQTVDAVCGELRRAVDGRLRVSGARVDALKVRLERCNPSVRLGERRERLAFATYRLTAAVRGLLETKGRRLAAADLRRVPAIAAYLGRQRTELKLAAAILDGRDPTRILQRGYAIVTVDGVAVRDAASVAPGSVIGAQLARGRLLARVETAINDGGR